MRKKKRLLWCHPDDYSRPVSAEFVDGYLPLQPPKNLSVDQIEAIRYFHSLGLSNGFIADDVGCSVMSVWRVINRRREGTLGINTRN